MEREEQENVEGSERIVRLMGCSHGLDIAAYAASFVMDSVRKRLAVTGLQTLSAYGERLGGDRAEAEALFDALRIGYSEFFRNPLTFAVLEQVVLPGLVAEKERSGRGEVRVWSAGCARGQEAWSVAMLLDELSAARARPVPYRVIATDRCEDDLSAARAGVYGAEALEAVRLRQLRTCFSRQGEAYTVAPRLRERVDFSVYDLLQEGTKCPAASIYGDFDLILCCNVLYYYQSVRQQRMLSRLCYALSDGGFFVTGEAERELAAGQSGLRAVAPPAAVFQKRGVS